MNVTAKAINNNGWFASLWSGEARLVKAFYEAHLFWHILIALFLFLLLPTIVARLPLEFNDSVHFILFPAIGIAYIYTLFTYIVIWRCAFNVNNPKWGYVARVYVVILFIQTLYKIITKMLIIT